MTSSDSPKDSFRAIDPLAEIRHRAQQIWEERGRPDGTTWENFVEDAEKDLLAGRSAGVPSSRRRPPTETLTVSPEMEKIRHESKDPFVAALARAFDVLLNWHECYCLAQLLVQHSFLLRSTGETLPPTDDGIAEILATLAGEYPERVGLAPAEPLTPSAPFSDRVHYWRGQVGLWRKKDAPLSFTDRNTMHRLQEAIHARGEIGLSQQQP